MFFLLLMTLSQSNASVESIDPSFGEIGSTVTIHGSDFSPTPQANTVYFGGMKAQVAFSTENELTVSVPNGAPYAPIAVYSDGFYQTSNQRFNTTFNAAEELTVSHLSNQLDNPYLGTKYKGIQIADMNGDGVPNIVTSQAGEGSLAYLTVYDTVFDQNGIISIEESVALDFQTGVYSMAHDIALGDFNGDGLLDVIASEYGDITDNFESHTCVFINTTVNQSLSFEDPIIYLGDGYEGYAQAQDINGDGRLDIVTSRTSWHQMGVYLNTTEGGIVSFADKVVIDDYVDPRPGFADLNGDGLVDMVSSASTTDSRDVYVYLNTSTEDNIDFNLELVIQSGGEHANWPTDYNWSAYSPTLADMDGDGRLEIIVVNGTCGLCSPSGVSILRNTSTAAGLGFEYDYSDFYQYASNSVPTRIGISDLNGDGKPDILTADWMGGISIIVNSSSEGNIALEEQMQIGVGNYPNPLAMADLNKDSTPEIVVSNWEVEGMRVIHNFIPIDDSAILGDLNGDGVLNVVDAITLVYMILGFQDTTDDADLNSDGVINITDAITLVLLVFSGS